VHGTHAERPDHDALPEIEGRTMGMNYGFEKIWFIAPVPAGSKNPRPLQNRRSHTQSRPGRGALWAERRARRPGEAGACGGMADHRIFRARLG
jgi:hypothetical protein